MNKCIFLDRDGVLNVERGDYTYLTKDFIIPKGVPEAIQKIKAAGYLAIVVTNQAGITKGLYTREQMNECHKLLMEKTNNLIDKIYYSPYHPNFSASLTRKPDTLMIEKAIARFQIDPHKSWLIGDRCRDIASAQTMKIRTVLVADQMPSECNPTFIAQNLLTAINQII